jgi:Ribosomal protein L1p/L10e family
MRVSIGRYRVVQCVTFVFQCREFLRCFSAVKVGTTGFTVKQLAANISAVIEPIVALIPRKWSNILQIFLKVCGCGLAWLGLAWLGLAWLGLAWLGLAWLGLERTLM